MADRAPWTVDAYETEQGERPVLSFLQGLQGRNQAEALALVKLLQERGNSLRRPQSGALGEGLFELRGKEVRIFYVFLPNRVAVLLDGEVKKRDDIPVKTLERVRGYQKEVMRRRRGSRREEVAVSKKTAVMEWIDGRLKADARLAGDVDEILNEMRLAQDLAALREKRKLSQRQAAELLGTSQPYIAKLESGRVKNVGVGTLVKYAQALGGTVTVQVRSRPHAVVARRTRLKKAG